MQLPRLRSVVLLIICLLTLTLIPRLPARAQGSAGDSDEIELGARLYAENCAVCHGEDGQGRVGATLSKDWPSIRPDLEVRETIINGVSGSFMPAWSKENGGPLGEEEIDAVVAYILSWQTGGAQVPVLPTSTPHPPITPVPDVEGDPNRGAILYGQNCAVCHGDNGQGRIGATLAKDWPSIRPDLQVEQTIINGISGSFMPAWSQDQGGPLTREEIDDVVAFVLTWSTQPGQSEGTVPPQPSPTPTPVEVPGGNTGVIVGAIVLVLIVIGGVIWASRR